METRQALKKAKVVTLMTSQLPRFGCLFLSCQQQKKHPKQGCCDVIKVLFISCRLQDNRYSGRTLKEVSCRNNTYHLFRSKDITGILAYKKNHGSSNNIRFIVKYNLRIVERHISRDFFRDAVTVSFILQNTLVHTHDHRVALYMVGICSRRKDFVIFSSSTVGEKSIFFSQVAQGGKSQVFVSLPIIFLFLFRSLFFVVFFFCSFRFN